MEKKYVGKDIIVYFDSEKCMHSANCVKNLTTVFDIKKKPWINPDADFSLKIAKTIDRCPSKALRYEMINEEPNLSYKMNEARCQAECIYQNKVIGVCQFDIENNTLNINHTIVKDNFSGLGIAKKLVLIVVDFSSNNGLKINPVCSYAQKLLTSDDKYSYILK